jgi:hypothetical protein
MNRLPTKRNLLKNIKTAQARHKKVNGAKRIKFFKLGENYVRKDLHTNFGGSHQRGISICPNFKMILLFSGSDNSEYNDYWSDENTFVYCGQRSQEDKPHFGKCNTALRDHVKDGYRVFLFQARSPYARCLGEFENVSYKFKPTYDGKFNELVFYLRRTGDEIVDVMNIEEVKIQDVKIQEVKMQTEIPRINMKRSLEFDEGPVVKKRKLSHLDGMVKTETLKQKNEVITNTKEAKFLSPTLEDRDMKKKLIKRHERKIVKPERSVDPIENITQKNGGTMFLQERKLVPVLEARDKFIPKGKQVLKTNTKVNPHEEEKYNPQSKHIVNPWSSEEEEIDIMTVKQEVKIKVEQRDRITIKEEEELKYIAKEESKYITQKFEPEKKWKPIKTMEGGRIQITRSSSIPDLQHEITDSNNNTTGPMRVERTNVMSPTRVQFSRNSLPDDKKERLLLIRERLSHLHVPDSESSEQHPSSILANEDYLFEDPDDNYQEDDIYSLFQDSSNSDN